MIKYPYTFDISAKDTPGMLNIQSTPLHIETMIDAILVYENLRPAALIQPFDYGERGCAVRPKTDELLRLIHAEFPDMIFSEKYGGGYQGILMAKQSFDGIAVNMGRTLGYPCWREFNPNDDSIGQKRSIHVFIEYSDEASSQSYEILTNVCADFSKLDVFKKFAKDALAILQTPKYADMFVMKPTSYNIETVTEPTAKFVLAKLARMKLPSGETNKITQADKYKIANIMWNTVGDGGDLYILAFFEYDNPLHRGFMIGLLAMYIHDPTAVFRPIQNDPIRGKKHDEKTEIASKWTLWLLNDMAVKTKQNYTTPELLKGRNAQTLALATSIAGGQTITHDILMNAASIINIEYGADMFDFLIGSHREFRPEIGEHVGLIVFLLMSSACEALSVYFPLSRVPEKAKKIKDILEKRTETIIIAAERLVPDGALPPEELPMLQIRTKKHNRSPQTPPPTPLRKKGKNGSVTGERLTGGGTTNQHRHRIIHDTPIQCVVA